MASRGSPTASLLDLPSPPDLTFAGGCHSSVCHVLPHLSICWGDCRLAWPQFQLMLASISLSFSFFSTDSLTHFLIADLPPLLFILQGFKLHLFGLLFSIQWDYPTLCSVGSKPLAIPLTRFHILVFGHSGPGSGSGAFLDAAILS